MAKETGQPGVTVDPDLLAKLEAANARLAEQDAQIAALKAAGVGKLTLKVSAQGGVSVYGMGRFPVTLYQSQWAKLLDYAPQIRAFIKAHGSELSTKDSKAPTGNGAA